ncbi:MAG TPA: radical SAM protein [Novimethylophilus sp.]|jgi:hypothetical protein|uniref:radical SAM protein n=1 Tax=Novimethylophilus sp. TaxID=2137426 RepID=UPI002F407F95
MNTFRQQEIHPQTDLPSLALPAELNYIAVFLTLDCNLNCSYCINDPEQSGQRRELFNNPQTALPPEAWVRALARIPFSADLPITLQGGEPMIYWGSRGLGEIMAPLPHYFDLLTNFALKPEKFASILNGQQAKLQRQAPYPSIRVSYHRDEMDRAWKGRGFEELVERCEALAEYGFKVSPVKAESDVGIYMVAHPENVLTSQMKTVYENRVPFETKEFLGLYNGHLHGAYLYPFSTHLTAAGIHPHTLSCECRTSELLMDPLGFVWGCHFYLYEAWKAGTAAREFPALKAINYSYQENFAQFFAGQAIKPIGHMLDPEFTMDSLRQFRSCHFYGRCIGCDTKVKNNRFQSLDDMSIAHTSVEVRNIAMPQKLLDHPEILPHQRKYLQA